MKIIEALYKIYDYGTTIEEIRNDMEIGYLSFNTCRSGRDVLWYLDNKKEICIYLDTLKELSQEEIEKELM